MRITKFFFGGLVILIPLIVCAKIVTAQSDGIYQNIFHYAVSNQIIEKTQKQNLFSVLKDLNKTRGFYFLFSDSSIANKQVTVPDLNEDIESILSELLKNTGLKYKKVSKNTFVITTDKPNATKTSNENLYNLIETPYGELRFASINSPYYEPPVKVVGKVISSKDGRPMEGVSVKVKGKKIGTSTKSDGSFTLDVPDNSAVLEFSAVGYLSTTAKVGESGIVSISLQEAASDLEDVVVVAYGTQKRSTFTGAATIVNNQMIEDVPRTSFQESLQGNAVGVLSTNGTGQPGAAPDIRIRGVGSITASSAPLYVVDGVPLVSGDISNGLGSNTIAALNPLDIESIAILKDATATALYGSRGANGVILITTRKGKAGKTLVDCRMQTGASFYTLKNSKDRTLSTTQMLEYLREGWKNAGNDPSQFNAQIPQGLDSTVNTDWFKQVLREGKYSNLSLNVSGGNEKTTFYASGGLFQIDGVQKATDYKKITGLINVTHRASDKFTLNAGISGAYQLSNSSVTGAYYQNPTRAMYRLQDWLKPLNADGTYNTSFNDGYNPDAIQSADIRRTTTYVLRGTANGVYRVARGLTLESTAGLDYSHAYNLLYNDPRYGNDNVAQGGSIENFSGDIANWIWTNIVRYKRRINVDNSFEVFGGYEASKRNDNTIDAIGYNLAQIGRYSISNAAIPKQPTAILQQEALVSQFVDGNYSYKNRYYFSASFREDQQSRFALQNGSFWSVGAGWDVSKEKFFKVDWIYNLKLRGSYGKTGNSVGLADYGYQGLYTLNSSYGDEAGMTFSQLQNDSLTWEKNYPWDFGFDISVLKNRVAATFDWYTRRTTDLIMAFPLSGVSGLTVSNGNYGAMRNTGIEVILNTVNIVPRTANGFRWATQINFTTNQNTILKLVRSTTGTYDRHVGTDFYQWWLPTYAGVDSSNGQALWLTGHDTTGKATTTNSYSTATNHYYDQGSALPKFWGGITNVFSYKNVSLLVLIYYNYGNKIYDDNGVFNSSDGSTGFSSTGNVPLYDFNHRWQKPGDVSGTPAPVYLGTQTGISNMNSTRFLYDGSYIRLRDVMLSYDLPAKMMSKARIATAKIYLRANNLYTLVKDKRLIYDPQTGVTGQINLQPPQMVTILFGANINF